jgi:predicted lysophospholipase L1 biosynthesis ABC-type transport system permease subunit
MDVGLVLPMVLMGLHKGMEYGHNRALELPNLPRDKPTLSEVDQAVLALAVILTIVLFLASPELLMVLLLGSAWLSFLVSYGVSALLAFLITRYTFRKRRAA